MSYVIYLRKSRADIEAEERGEGETLARHEAALLALAEKQGLAIGAIYKEIVSGETIAARPEMQKLLDEVASGKWDGVLVMEIERLARGNTMDQGLVSNAFTYSGTKIITPAKTYDPENEFDQEYFEFNLFMSRREYKTIRRRMEAGRIASVKEGCYLGTRDPYGYTRYYNADLGKHTLKIIEDEAKIVQLVYDLFVNGGLGTTRVANRINELGVKTKFGEKWTGSTVRDIIRNPLYMGYVRWYNRRQKKAVDGSVHNPRSAESDVLIIKGLHEPIVSEELWHRANAIIPINHDHSCHDKPLRNQFAGLIKCNCCGHSMINRKYVSYATPRYECVNKYCDTVGSNADVIDDMVFDTIRKAYKDYQLLAEKGELIKPPSKEKDVLSAELKKLFAQRDKLYDLLEQGIYTPEVYLQRQQNVADKIKTCENRLSQLKVIDAYQISAAEACQRIKYVLDRIDSCETVSDRNRLLKTIIKKITYHKTTNDQRDDVSDLTVTVEFLF